MCDFVARRGRRRAWRAQREGKIEKKMAQDVKKAFDEKYKGTWHCVAGRSFGCSITHETSYSIFFTANLVSFLVFQARSGAAVTRAWCACGVTCRIRRLCVCLACALLRGPVRCCVCARGCEPAAVGFCCCCCCCCCCR